MRRLLILPALAVAALVHAQTLTTYTDPTHHSTFQYPSVWKRVPHPNAYSQPLAVTRKAAVTVEFTGDHNVYRKTDLESLDFTYQPRPTPTKEACLKLAAINDTDAPKPQLTTLNGTVFLHGKGSLGSAGHGVDADVYVTWRSGTCYVFEADFFTVSLLDDTRNLTPQEQQALQRHLDAIMQSVRLPPEGE